MAKNTRRSFVKASVMAAASITLGACSSNTTKQGNSITTSQEKNNKEPLFTSMTSDQIMMLLDLTVDKYMELSGNCAQSAFMALKEVFELPGKDIVKALTPMPGIAEKGLTCGALTGPLMAIGLVYGRDDLADWEAYRASLKPAGRFVDEFREMQGTTECGVIHEHKFGMRFNLVDEEDLKSYRSVDGPAVCRGIVKQSVRLAAAILLEKFPDH